MIVFMAIARFNVTEQLADAPLPDSLQAPPVNRPLLRVVVKLTVPVGVFAVPEPVSVTLAVHEARPRLIAMQRAWVEVVRLVTVTVPWPLLGKWVPSPPKLTVMVCVPDPTWPGV